MLSILGRKCARIGVVAIVMVLMTPFAYATEWVRVALLQHSPSIKLSADQTLRLRFSSGQTVVAETRIVIAPSGQGLHVNGRATGEQMVSIQSPAGRLELSSATRSNGTHIQEVTGHLEIRNQGTTLLIVNRVDLEEYVAGVVGSEINPDWHLEALKAQAVAARTYVLHKKMVNATQPFDVVADVQDQVYQGNASVRESVRRAVHETKGMVLTYDKRPIFAAYSSTAAGRTEDAINVWSLDVPYLKGVDCPFDVKAPRYQWEASIGLTEMEYHLRKEGYDVGTIATLAPYRFTQAGRVNDVRILHSLGELIIRGQDFRRIMGYMVLPSTQFSIAKFGPEVVFVGKGAGHAVGMCQWGAKELAELGYRYESIMQYYYPGTELINVRYADLTPPPS